MGIRGKLNSNDPFVSVGNVSRILPILKSRLPKSCNVYNMAMKHQKFPTEMNFYTLKGDLTDSSWIVATYFREDCGIDINISAPSNLEGMDEMQEGLSKTSLIDWDAQYQFYAIDRAISPMIRDLSIGKGNSTGMNPNLMFYLPEQNCLQLRQTKLMPGEDVSVKPLDPKLGTDFLLSTWKFASKGSIQYIQKLLTRNESVGLHLDDDKSPVSGVAMAGSGLMTMLYTAPEFRRKGYGQMVMQEQMRALTTKDLIPCCCVEFRNEASKAFQIKAGLQFSHDVDFIFYKPCQF